MPDEKIIEQFLDSFEKIYTFLRPHTPISRTAVKSVGGAKRGVKAGSKIELDMWKSSALIIISLLTDNGTKPCLQQEIESIFSWKYENKNKLNDAKGALNVLESVNLIKKDAFDGNRQFNTISLTNEGIAFIKKLRDARRKDILTIISQLGVIDEDKFPYEKLTLGLTYLADNLWTLVQTGAKELHEKSKAENKAKPKKKHFPAK